MNRPIESSSHDNGASSAAHHSSRRVFLKQASVCSSIGVAFSAGSLPSPSPASQVTGNTSNWQTWRGPQGNNHVVGAPNILTTIDNSEIAWSTLVPGRGHSSPIVYDDQIFLTTADKAAGTQSVLAITRQGKPAWQRVVHRGGIPAANHPKNTEASPSVACDGKSLFSAFYNDKAVRLTKLSLDGQVEWQKSVHSYFPSKYKYGYAASPCLYRDQIILVGDYDGDSFLASLDRNTGETIWKVKRPSKISFSSPIIANIAGRDQLLLSGCEQVASYDPANGSLLWRVPGATTYATCGTMVWEGDRVYASGGYPKAETVCIRADGSGKVLWANSVKCYEQSMLCHDGHVYAVSDGGVAYCWRGTDGKALWKKRLGGNYSSSPLLVGNDIHVFNERGEGFAFAASPSAFQERGRSRVGDEVFSSPIVVDDTMYLRVAVRRERRQESLLAIRATA
ncbi:MAG: PQQ-binding-like beta-propeller repeat protein [Planctomycetota bacterium]